MDGAEHADWTVRLHLGDEADTAALAVWLGARLVAGDTVFLLGPIGAGKSHFARALIRSRLPQGEAGADIPSPTFTLVQTYTAADGAEIWHADLYRLTSVDEVAELGLLDAFEFAICLVEWPDRLEDLAPATALTLHFTPDTKSDMRAVTLSGGPRHRALADALKSNDLWTHADE